MNVRSPLGLLALVLVLLLPGPTALQAQVGRTCSVFNQCPRGYSCQPGIPQRCYNSPRLEGQPCSAGFSCGAGLRCAPGVQKCVKATAPATGIIEKAGTAVGVSPQGTLACTDMALRCPTGEAFVRGTSWDATRLMCSPSRPMATVVAQRCPRPYAANPALQAKWDAAAAQGAACSAEWREAGIDARGPYSAVFNDACIVHDLCYRSARTQAQCDTDMLENMKAVCQKLDILMPTTAGVSVAACLSAAASGYGIVSAKGKPSYDGNQRDFAYPAGGGPRPAAASVVSRGKRTAQSSTEHGGVAARAVDGRVDGNWGAGSVTHTGNAAGSWWMVDLGAEHRIDGIVVYNRTDCCAERLNAVVVVTLAEGWPSNSITHTWQLGAPRPNYTAPISSGSPVYGRYVYVVLNGASWLSLAEVEVTGAPR